MSGYADWDVLLSDDRVTTIERALRKARPDLPAESVLITFVQPELDTIHNGEQVHVKPLAVFAIITPDPRHPETNKMTQGAMDLAEWRAKDRTWKTFVGQRDPAIGAFRHIAKTHIEVIENLKALSN